MRTIDIDFYFGGSLGQCQRCAGIRRLNDLALQWDGARVCRATCWDPLPDTMKPPRIMVEGLPRPDASPETPSVFVDGPFNPNDWPSGQTGGY